jgi:rubrerythrin
MSFENLTEIVDFAIEKEVEAAEFYEAASRQEAMSGIREMLTDFARQERKHEALLKTFQKQGLDKSVESYKLRWIKDIKRSNYVVEMPYTPNMAYNELLMLAMKREEKALALYNEMLARTENPDAKKLFQMLCQEEARHKLALETKYDDYMAEMGD